jgi:hypothetical protein
MPSAPVTVGAILQKQDTTAGEVNAPPAFFDPVESVGTKSARHDRAHAPETVFRS